MSSFGQKAKLWWRLRRRPLWDFSVELVLNTASIAVTVILLRLFLVAPFQVSGESMWPTLYNYEFILVNRIGYAHMLGWDFGEPQRGDIVVLRPPIMPSEYFVKRVVGLPGEKVEIKGGEVRIYNKEHTNGFQLDESYLAPENMDHTYITYSGPNESKVFEVPPDNYFVLGDNRTRSSDSRQWISSETGQEEPFIHRRNIDGKVFFVFWPIKLMRQIDSYSYFAEATSDSGSQLGAVAPRPALVR
jgi:signal peptidase I